MAFTSPDKSCSDAKQRRGRRAEANKFNPCEGSEAGSRLFRARLLLDACFPDVLGPVVNGMGPFWINILPFQESIFFVFFVCLSVFSESPVIPAHREAGMHPIRQAGGKEAIRRKSRSDPNPNHAQ